MEPSTTRSPTPRKPSRWLTLPHAFGCCSAVLASLASTQEASTQLLPGEHSVLMDYAATTHSVGNGVDDLVAADIDGDGDLDVISANAASNRVRLLVNDGTGAFSQQALAVPGSPSALSPGDFDGDGDLDILVGLYTQLRLLVNDGAGHFTPLPPLALSAVDLDVVAVVAHDVDGNGTLDAVVGIYDHNLPSGSYTGGVLVAFGDGAGQFALGKTHELPLPAHRLVAADFDGDGELDVAALSGYVSASKVDVAFGDGHGGFVNSSAEYSAGLYASGLEQGDWDGDGDVDLAAGGKYSLPLLLNDGSGNFGVGQVLNPGYYTKGIAAGDVDHDGDTDLLATSGSSQSMRLYANQGGGSFVLEATLPATLQTLSVMLADTNGDGYLDPWAGDYSTGQVTAGASHCLVARYGQAVPNSLGCLPYLTASGTPALGSADFVVSAGDLLISQPALMLASLAPASLPAFGGQVLVAQPWHGLNLLTSPGSGQPSVCDGTINLPLGSSTLGLLGTGTRFHLQLLSLDPGMPTSYQQVSLTNGLWFEVAP